MSVSSYRSKIIRIVEVLLVFKHVTSCACAEGVALALVMHGYTTDPCVLM
jgi:hypothetical protein